MSAKNVVAGPRFTVIATVYPDERGRRALASVRRQAFEDYEIVAVVGGSAQEPDDFAREFECRVIVSASSFEPAARNLALAEARGRLAAFIGPADVWHPNYLSYHAKLFDLYPQALFGFTNYYRQSSEGSGPVAQGFFDSAAPNALVQMAIDPFVHTLSSVAAPLASIRAVHGFNSAASVRSDLDLVVRLLAGSAERKRLACLDGPAINLPQVAVLTEDVPDRTDRDIRVPSAERTAFLDQVFAYPFMKPFEQYRSVVDGPNR